MTIQVQTTTKSAVLVYHHTQDDVKGYIFNVGGTIVFVAEGEADKLARYMLFADQTEAETPETA